MGVRLHLSEVKGPVMDRLAGTEFIEALQGRVHLSQHQAMAATAALRLAEPTHPAPVLREAMT
ncbi:hypothetical protein D3C87_1978080 [compost metagenome]